MYLQKIEHSHIHILQSINGLQLYSHKKLSNFTCVFPTASKVQLYSLKHQTYSINGLQLYSLQHQQLTGVFPTESKLYSLQHHRHICIPYSINGLHLNSLQHQSYIPYSIKYTVVFPTEQAMIHSYVPCGTLVQFISTDQFCTYNHISKRALLAYKSITDSQLYYRYLKIDSTVVVFLWLSQIP